MTNRNLLRAQLLIEAADLLDEAHIQDPNTGKWHSVNTNDRIAVHQLQKNDRNKGYNEEIPSLSSREISIHKAGSKYMDPKWNDNSKKHRVARAMGRSRLGLIKDAGYRDSRISANDDE